MSVKAFAINIAQAVLDDLQTRLARTRFPDAIEAAGWRRGTSLVYLEELVKHWQTEFDWRARERELNRFHHFQSQVDGLDIHFIHEQGRGSCPLPIILTHGWPDSFWRFKKLIPLLVEEEDGISFDVVVPSIPGYGFSGKPKEAGTLFRIPDVFARLMTGELGYPEFAAHGGDWGGTITDLLARRHGRSLVGIHLTDVPFLHLLSRPDQLLPAEEAYVARCRKWQKEEGAYASIQSTKPQSLAYGLNDSPAALAAWIVEKMRGWSDSHGDVEACFSKDELLTNIMIYWVTGTIASSFELYRDGLGAGAPEASPEVMAAANGYVYVPTGIASFPRDLRPPPREWAERFFNVQHWTQMSRGGHFAAFEEPEALARDLRAFFGPLWRKHNS